MHSYKLSNGQTCNYAYTSSHFIEEEYLNSWCEERKMKSDHSGAREKEGRREHRFLRYEGKERRERQCTVAEVK